MQWLSIDLNYITGDCRNYYDENHCGRNCSGCYEHGIVAHGSAPPQPEAYQSELEVRELLNRTQITRVVVRDCHADINSLLHRGDIVYHIDEHDDADGCGSAGDLHCCNWVTFARRRGIEVRPLVDMVDMVHATTITGPCAVFICLSIPYTNEVAQDILGRMLCRMPFRGRVDFRLSSMKQR